MKKLFSFKKMSSKFAFIVVAAVILVGGAAVGYMQTRIIDEIDRHARLYVQYRLLEVVESCDVAIVGGQDTAYLQDIVSQVVLYETGLAILANTTGELYTTSDFVARINASDIASLLSFAEGNPTVTTDMTINNIAFTVAHSRLYNNYSLFVLAPRSEVMAEANASLMRFVFIFIGVVIPLIIVSRLIGKSIAAPLVKLNGVLKKAGTSGDITLTPEEMSTMNELMQKKDEIGQCVGSAVELFKHISHIAGELETLSSGDLTVKTNIISEKDILGKSLNQMVDNLNSIFGEINLSTNQVSAGSKQISDGAQTLAQGSTEQAATVEELSSSISEIAQKTKDNADMASRAAALAESIMQNAEKGNEHMDDMIAAVKEINQASQNISKVIKVIDDIAFQTNILALNAAVEAARAGQHGKGFAVVAEEVRNLAAKSADAAKDTGGLIANSMEKAELGTKIAQDTAASLAEIVVGINESNQLVSEIAKSSEEQSLGITQVNQGIDQVSQVVQQNSATAQQSAAASEEMSGQSDILQQLVAQFKLKESASALRQLPSSKQPAQDFEPTQDNSSGDFGKY